MKTNKDTSPRAEVNSKITSRQKSLWKDGGPRPKNRVRGIQLARSLSRRGEPVYRVTDMAGGTRHTYERKTRVEAVALYEEIAARRGTLEGVLSITPSETSALLAWRAWKTQRVLDGLPVPPLDELLRKAMNATEEEDHPGLPVAEAFAQFVDHLRRAGFNSLHVANVGTNLRNIAESLPEGASLGTVTVEAAIVALKEAFGRTAHGNPSPSTQKKIYNAASSCWNYFIDLGDVKENPWRAAYKRIGVAEAPLRLRPRKEYTDPDSLRRMLAYTLESNPRFLPILSIAAFCGLRPSEIIRMTWSHVLLEGEESAVIVGEGATKTDAAARKVRLCPAGVAWIKAGLAKTGTPEPSAYVCPGGTEKGRSKLWCNHIQRIQTDCPPKVYPENVAEGAWARDLLRHSFGTYYRAAVDSIAATAEAMGNTITVCKAHYSRPVTKAEGEAWFAVAP